MGFAAAAAKALRGARRTLSRSLLLGQLLHHAGLAESGHWDKIEDMVTNFAAEIDAWGHIPTATAPTI
jgi:hypothetical protein